jgi:hypothetical protein
MSFGDLLKVECSMMYKFPLSWCYSHNGKDFRVDSAGCTVRELLQHHGTEVRRKQDPGYWVKAMKAAIDRDRRFAENYQAPSYVIDDVRFENEARMVKDLGGVLIRIQPYPEWVPGPHADHISETDLDDIGGWDLVLSPAFGGLETCLPLIDALLMQEGVIEELK